MQWFAATKRKRDEPIVPQPNAPIAKKQKKKKNKQKQKQNPASQTYSYQSPGYIEPGSSYALGEQLQQWQGAALNPYEASYGIGPVLANSSLAPLLDQEALFQRQAQGNLPVNPLYHTGYFPPMLAPSYQQTSQPLPSRPPCPPPSHHMQKSLNEGISPMSNPRPVLSGANTTRLRFRDEDLYEAQAPQSWSSNVQGMSSTVHVSTDRGLRAAPTSRPPPPPPPPPPKPVPTPSLSSPAPISKPSLPATPASTGLISTTSSSALPIGMIADGDSTSTHGLFPLLPGRRIKTACAIVMENVPKAFRNDEFVRTWSKRTAGIVPHFHNINKDKGKVLLVFQSPELARKAFDSPRLPGGKGREGIRVWWYREAHSDRSPQKKPSKVLAPAPLPRPKPPPVMIDLEEGEIEEASLSSRVSPKTVVAERKAAVAAPIVVDPPLSKKARKRLRAAQMSNLPPHPSLSLASPSKSRPRTPPPMTQAEMSGFAYTGPSMEKVHVKDFKTGIWTHHASVEGFSMRTRLGGPPYQEPPDNARGDSIASSASGSPMLDIVVDLPMDDGMQDMDLESPVSPRHHVNTYDEAHAAGTGYLSQFPFAPKSRPYDADPASSALPPLPASARAPSPERDFVVPQIVAPVISNRTVDQRVQPVIMAQPVPVAQPTPLAHALRVSKHFVPHIQTPPISTPTPPSDTPSEPRAMKNLPKGPRSLLERTKELEQRLARSKHEMARPVERKTAPAPVKERAKVPLPPYVTTPLPPRPAHLPPRPGSLPPVVPSPILLPPKAPSPALLPPTTPNPITPPSPPPSAITHVPSVPENPVVAVDKLSMEENLRRLVLQSRKAKTKAISPVGPATTLQLPNATPMSAPDFARSVPSSLVSSDDLAVSFINEAIQSAPVATPASIKIELAAKQKRLEQHINESKMLMAKLNTASSKAEKDNILGMLRERSRCVTTDSPSVWTAQ